MKRLLLLSSLLLLFAVALQAQFRMVGTGSWTTVNDSTYQATVVFQSDLTGNSYLASQITTSFRVFTGTEQLYRISAVSGTTFSQATLTIVEIPSTQGAPSGQVMVFNPNSKPAIPQVPFGSTGSTAQIQAAIDTYNARLHQASVATINGHVVEEEGTPLTQRANINFVGAGVTAADAGGKTVVTIPGGAAIAYDDLTSGTVTAQVVRLGGSATTIANPAAGEYNLVVQSGADFQRATVFGNNTTLNGSNEMVIRVNNSANTRDRRVTVEITDVSNGSLVDQQATATVHTQAVSGNITTITIPGLNGFGATGFRINIR